MLTELFQELRNWFDVARYYGRFEIKDNEVISYNDDDILQYGQYFRIIGSIFNDGVYKYGDELKDEVFEGSVWPMAVPPSVIELAEEIQDWCDKYGGTDSAAMSPYQSESFGGYSYSKASGGSSADGSSGSTANWKTVYADRLSRWRKI